MKTINPNIRANFKRFLAVGAYSTPPGRAACALRNARTVEEFRQAEWADLVRIQAEPENESLESVFGKEVAEREAESVEHYGVWVVSAEVNHGNESSGDDWQVVDSVGMCVYATPCDPFQNPYVVDLMRAALDAIPQEGNVDELCTSLDS